MVPIQLILLLGAAASGIPCARGEVKSSKMAGIGFKFRFQGSGFIRLYHTSFFLKMARSRASFSGAVEC